ncbi:hypothetical protein ACH5RR_019205 [Cinchona calisaya]|uniref:Pentatricopeptide repeat-containing protein n=1 Tax=Cinchona calisaya TaxID=153742 RepID=A0ABD2ZNS5_9GENT
MQRYATSGCLKKALEALSLMRFVPGKPTVYDYNSMIYCYLKSENVLFGELVEVYNGMKRFGPCPNALTYNTLLNGMVLIGRLKYGTFIAEEMWKSGFLPSFKCLSKLLNRLIWFGYLIDSRNVLDMLLRLYYVPIEPVMNMLIIGLSKAGMVREAYFVVLVLLDKGLVRGAYNFNPLLWAFSKSYSSCSALAFFVLLRRRDSYIMLVRIPLWFMDFVGMAYGMMSFIVWLKWKLMAVSLI